MVCVFNTMILIEGNGIIVFFSICSEFPTQGKARKLAKIADIYAGNFFRF